MDNKIATEFEKVLDYISQPGIYKAVQDLSKTIEKFINPLKTNPLEAHSEVLKDTGDS